MTQLSLDLQEGVRRAQDGARRAVEHADRVEPDWSDRALAFLVEYAHQHDEFRIEEVRAAAEQAGVAVPPSRRAWGHIALRASREGVVSHAGWVRAVDPTMNAQPVSLWRSRVHK